jgi:transposase InsO family protein
MSFEDAWEKVESWRRDYDKNRPLSSLDNATPEELAAQVESDTTGLNQYFEAVINGLHI